MPFTNATRTILAAVIAASAAACGAQSVTDIPPGATALRVQSFSSEVVQLFHTGLEERQRTVIRDAAAWAALWNEITAPYQPRPALPAVDFATEMVIVASMGTRPTGGYAITIDGVYDADGKLYVAVRETSPGAGCMLTQALTSPMTAVRVPRRAAGIIVVERVEVKNC